MNKQIIIELFEATYNEEFQQFGIGILGVGTRFLLFIGTDNNKWIINLLFIKIKDYE